MKISHLFFFLLVVMGSGFRSFNSDVEFVCVKTHKATNTCYFNFKVGGGKYCYTDIGCKKSRKRDEVIKKAKEGKLALAKDWKISCSEPKE